MHAGHLARTHWITSWSICPNANIVHEDDIDDTISSLTITVPNASLNLNGGTLDLSGSGEPGPFDVPGSVDFAEQDYGSVHLNGGVLANAIVSANTAIGVFGSLHVCGSGTVCGRDRRGRAERHDRGQ